MKTYKSFKQYIQQLTETETATTVANLGTNPDHKLGSTKRRKKKKSEEELTEESPPDPEIEKFIKKNKDKFKTKYGDKEGDRRLYALAWTMFNKKNGDK